MKNNNRKHHTYDLAYGTVDVTIEVKHFSTYKDKDIRLQLKVDPNNPTFEGYIYDQTIVIPLIDDKIGDFELPPIVSPLTKGRIRDGINDFLDGMYK